MARTRTPDAAEATAAPPARRPLPRLPADAAHRLRPREGRALSVDSGSLREPRERQRPSELVSGYLSAIAIFVSLVALAWHTLRLSPAAMLLAVIAAAMAGRDKRLALAAALIAAFCFFLGMTISVLVSRPLW